ncbi:arsenite methyltransferase [Nothobranchius furzeri]|uniref:Arsenite methyltransferase n=1 Tax=Nothobranchius furzeri TaxID=105023 RepID=A0A9D2YEA6_NOTFU|nr:arsenite methyltransferase [Nothobranchius furzeri]KAF7219012.1 arsenite methyltransferase-like [Nothobranchius furzeri]
MAAGEDMRGKVKEYYGLCLETSRDLQTSAASCWSTCSPLPRSVTEALGQVHHEVSKRFFGCGLPFPAKLEGCRVLDLGSGSGRDVFAFSKLVGPDGHVTGIDMTEELISASRQYVEYHQKKFGYEAPNVTFVQGYVEKLSEAAIQISSMDVVISNCVICLCPDKKVVLQEAYNILKEGGELYFSDMFASRVIPEHMKQDPVLWGEGMSGSLFWKDLISLAHETGFSTPLLVSASHIEVHNRDLKAKAGDIRYASGTYRLFKLPKRSARSGAVVTYKGTLSDFPEQLYFDSSHSFKKDVKVEVNAEMLAILQNSRFCSDFKIQMLDKPESTTQSTDPFCLLDPFLLADRRGASVRQCSKTHN